MNVGYGQKKMLLKNVGFAIKLELERYFHIKHMF